MEIYTTIQGDTWDTIAKKVYGNECHLDYLMANNVALLDYFIFPAGMKVKTPALVAQSESSTPIWRR